MLSLPDTHSNTTVSPEATVSTGAIAASNTPIRTVSGVAAILCRVMRSDLVRVAADRLSSRTTPAPSDQVLGNRATTGGVGVHRLGAAKLA